MASTNLVMKSQRYVKPHDFLEKLITCFWLKMNVVVFRISWKVCRCFYMNLTGKWKKNFRTVYSHLIWPLKCNIFFRLSSSDNSSGDKIGLPSVLKTATCCLRFVPATKCCCINAKVAKNFQHCYLGLSKIICWTIMSGLFSQFSCTTAWNSSVGFTSWPFGGSNTTQIFDCLIRSCIKGYYNAVWMDYCTFL